MYTVSPELYKKYRDEVVRLGLFVQEYSGYQVVRGERGLSDEEIAERLGLAVREVTEIRCIAELDLLPLDTWEKSDQFKEQKTRKFLKRVKQ